MDMGNDAARDSASPSKAEEAEDHLRSQEGDCENLEGPPDGFTFVLPFLDLPSLLTMERVSKSLRDAVRDNPLVWHHLQVERPAVRKLTDDMLITLVRRAHGQLKSLSLIQSWRITEDSLGWILAANPGLEKLSIPYSFYISAEGIVNLVEGHSLRAQSKGLPGLKQVQIRGLYNITKEHLARLHRALVSPGQDPLSQVMTPRYFESGVNTLGMHDVGPIDVDVCPLCENVRMVYDCTKHRINGTPDPACKGCTICIPRCEECGVCIRDMSHEKNVCSDLVCETCWFGLSKCLFCNRAVCGRHAHQFIQPGCNTFTCDRCLVSSENSDSIYSALWDRPT